MKLDIIGASNFVRRMYEACGSYQWAREWLINSIEADASWVEFGIEWQGVSKHGHYRRMISDDGCGMSKTELPKYFKALGAGSKKIGGIHENFGVGAKVASLPWNPEGVVVISYKNSQASMIWMKLDEDSQDYELHEFETDGDLQTVIDPTQVDWAKDDVDWGLVKPDRIKEHGTVVILLGSQSAQDTVIGNPDSDEAEIKGLSSYLNTRFWELDTEVTVVELRSEKKAQWPNSEKEKDDGKRPNNRKIRGAKHFVADVKHADGELKSRNVLFLDGQRVLAEAYLWKGARPAIHMYAKKQGYVAIRYKNELYEISTKPAIFRHFGIIEREVQNQVTIILEPELYTPGASNWGIYVDQSRTTLLFHGNGQKGVRAPLTDWGHEFVDHMPDDIWDEILKVRGKTGGSLNDESYRKRLQDKFGDRFSAPLFIKPTKPNTKTEPGTNTPEEVEVTDYPEIDTPPSPPGPRPPRPKPPKTITLKVKPGGKDRGTKRNRAVDIPSYRFVGKANFDKPWHLAVWAPQDKEGPSVLINKESPILEEAVNYHTDRYPVVHEEAVAETVREIFGEIAVCKIAHSAKLLKDVPSEELDEKYRNEEALTISLMGLLAEESLIAQRLGKFGRKSS